MKAFIAFCRINIMTKFTYSVRQLIADLPEVAGLFRESKNPLPEKTV